VRPRSGTCPALTRTDLADRALHLAIAQAQVEALEQDGQLSRHQHLTGFKGEPAEPPGT
jgi:hypothetical protein